MIANNSGNNPLQTVFWPKPKDDPKKKKKLAPADKTFSAYENPFEAFGDIGKTTINTLKTNAKAGREDTFKQIFGSEKLFQKNQKGEMRPGEDVNLSSLNPQKNETAKQESKANFRPWLEQRDYVGEILKAGQEANRKEAEETKQQVERIIQEIKNFSRAAKELEHKVIEATGSTMVKPGKYHKHFLDHVFSIIRDAKTKIDNAGSWLSTMQGKQKKGPGMGNKKPKSSYWNQVQKHGYGNYALSGERAISNQNG